MASDKPLEDGRLRGGLEGVDLKEAYCKRERGGVVG